MLGFSSADSSSAAKGESIADTARTVACYADIIAMRHPKEGAPYVASQFVDIPIINAGDGGHNHPTQTLTDLLTIRREKGRLDHFTIGFCGDLKFGRTVHSLIKALSRYDDINYIMISPEELQIPEYLKKDVFERKGIPFREVEKMEEVMPELDIIYMTRVQRERFLMRRIMCVSKTATYWIWISLKMQKKTCPSFIRCRVSMRFLLKWIRIRGHAISGRH